MESKVDVGTKGNLKVECSAETTWTNRKSMRNFGIRRVREEVEAHPCMCCTDSKLQLSSFPPPLLA
jgi:hypothetical protein